jgi:hypothetical protein
MQPPKETFRPLKILLACIIVSLASAFPLRAQTVAGTAWTLTRATSAGVAQRPDNHVTITLVANRSPASVSHVEVECSRIDGTCKSFVRLGPAPYHYKHQCKMSTKPGCLKWGAFVKGVDF